MSTPGRPIRLFIGASLADFSRVILATVVCLMEIEGLRVEQASTADGSDLVYDPLATPAGFLPAIPAASWTSLAASQPISAQGHTVPHFALTPDSPDCVDWIAVAAFFLVGMHEADDSIMESKEMWATPGSGIKRWGLTGEPTVHVAARAVSARIGLSTALAPPAPRWPPGKTWAVAITHDLDRYRKYRPAEFLRHAGFAAARGKMGVAGDSIAKALISAVGSLIVSDPYVASLDAWVSFQRSLDVRSAIYVSVVARTDQGAAANDVTYSLRDTQFAARIRDLEQEGWEIGLHSSINAWRTEGGFGREREKLRDAFSVSSVGVRGHYWSLDPAHRDESLRRIARAGFRYDSSLGMNLVHGYRRGSNYPYRPFDPTSGEILGVWEVPPVMMDESLLLAGTDNLARDSALRVRAAEVRRHGGLLVLDWHTDSLARGYMDDSAALVLEFLQAAVPDSECWVATPRAIVEWCSRERWSV